MGLFDFARNAGAKIGIGKSTAEKKADEAKKAAAEAAAKAHAQAQAEAKAAAKKAKESADAATKKAAEEAAARATAARMAAMKAAEEARSEAAKSSELEDFVTKLGLNVKNLDIRYNDGCAYVAGECATQADLEKLVLAVGNVGEVDKVIDTVTVAAEDEDEAQIYTVVSGDTLSKISKHFYGDANKYNTIFEANRPMLSHPDKIFPGQALRIPAL